MALVKCPECGREVSDKAKACPGCGRPVKIKKRGTVLLYAIALLFIVYLSGELIKNLRKEEINNTKPLVTSNTGEIASDWENGKEETIKILKEFEEDISHIDPHIEMTDKARKVYGDYNGAGKLMPTERGSCLADAISRKTNFISRMCPENCDVFTTKDVSSSKGWANGIDDYGNLWDLSYIFTKNGNIYLTYYLKRKNLANPQLYGVWQMKRK